MYQFKGRKLSNGEKTVRFDQKISKILEGKHDVIVLLSVPPGEKPTNNIYRLNKDLKTVWRSESIESKYPDMQILPFFDVDFSNRELVGYDFFSRKYRIDPKTGEVSKCDDVV